MEQNTQEQQEKREARRRRRIRNQMLAYMTVIIFIIVLAVGIVFGVRYLTKESRRNTQEKQNQIDQALDESQESEPESESEAVEPVVELTPEQKLDEIVNAGIEVMPLEDKVAGLFIVTPESITGVSAAVKAGDGTKDALTQYAVGGIIYNTRNIQSESQFKEMIDNTKLYANYPLFIAVEDEGGKISPLQEKGLADKQDGAKTLAAGGGEDKAYEAGKAIGTYLKDYGFNLNLAPVADLSSTENSIMKDRAYGDDADKVSPYVNSMIKGLKEQGIGTCLKHFPGMGSTSQDADEGLASTDRSADDFKNNEFKVFQSGIENGADMVMVSHMSAPSLAGDNTPCSMSSAVVTDILRRELDFDGVIITDSMSIAAVSDYYDADEAAVLALRAGCDMILMPEDFEKAYNGVLEAVKSGVISEERINDSLKRVYRIKYADRLEE